MRSYEWDFSLSWSLKISYTRKYPSTYPIIITISLLVESWISKITKYKSSFLSALPFFSYNISLRTFFYKLIFHLVFAFLPYPSKSTSIKKIRVLLSSSIHFTILTYLHIFPYSSLPSQTCWLHDFIPLTQSPVYL